MRFFSFLCLLCMNQLYSAQNRYMPKQPSKRNVITIAVVGATNPNTPRSPLNRFNTGSPMSVHDFTRIPGKCMQDLIADENKENKSTVTPPTKTRSIVDTKTSFSHSSDQDIKKSSCYCSIQ